MVETDEERLERIEDLHDRSGQFIQGFDSQTNKTTLARFIVDAALTEDNTGSGIFKYWYDDLGQDDYNGGYEMDYRMGVEQAERFSYRVGDIIAAVKDTYRDILVTMVMQKHLDRLKL